MLPNFLPAAPEIFLATATLALLLLGVILGETSTRIISILAMVCLAGTIVLLPLAGAQGRIVTFNGLFVVDRFATFTKVLALLASILGILMALDFNRRERIDRFEFPILILLSTVGMMAMISANDLIALYLGLELSSLCLYVLAAIDRDKVRATEAGLKYFILGSVASGMLLYGASLIYGFAGTTGFAGLASAFAGVVPPLGVIIGLMFVIAGLAFKISAVPFHMWTPDVYEGAATSVTAFFSVGPKIAAMALLLRLMTGPFGALLAQWQQVIIFVALASMAVGAFGGIVQRNIKRLMAYSSISNFGYVLIGLAAGNRVGVEGALVYMAVYLFMTLGAWTVVLTMRRRGEAVEQIADLAGLARTHPGLSASFLLFLFSMAGIPPLAGFLGKFYIFRSAIDSGLTALAVIGVLTSVISAFYYLWILKVMYFDEPVETLEPARAGELSGILVAAGLFVLLLLAWPSPLLAGAAQAAASLFPS